MAEINSLNVVDASNTARFPENMLAVNVNDSARALEGMLARWHSDTQGALATIGSANAYAVTLARTTAPYDGLTVMFRANFSCTGASTLNIGTGAISIETPQQTNTVANDILLNGIYVVRYNSTRAKWQLVSAPSTVVTTPPGYRFRSETRYTASGSFTPSAGTTRIEIEAVGGGGGAGGVDGNSTNDALSEGGGAGACVRKAVTNPTGAYTITIGAGGAGGAGNTNGTPGSATTVVGSSCNISAGGGSGGAGQAASSGSVRNNGAAGGTASGGDLNLHGNASPGASVLTGTAVQLSSGAGSIYGGAKITTVNGNGINADVPGAGGGPCRVSSATSTNYTGGSGANGIVIIREYY